MDDFSTILLKIIVAISVTIITKYLIPILKTWYETRVNDNLKKMIKEAVDAAEQVFKESGKGSLKKQDVLDQALAYIEKKGIKIDEKTLDTIIEAAVFTMNNNKNKKE